MYAETSGLEAVVIILGAIMGTSGLAAAIKTFWPSKTERETLQLSKHKDYVERNLNAQQKHIDNLEKHAENMETWNKRLQERCDKYEAAYLESKKREAETLQRLEAQSVVLAGQSHTIADQEVLLRTQEAKLAAQQMVINEQERRIADLETRLGGTAA